MIEKENLTVGELFKVLKEFSKTNNFDSDFRINAYEMRNSMWPYRIWAEICYQGIPLTVSFLFLGFGVFTREAVLIFRGYNILPIVWSDHLVTTAILVISFFIFLKYISERIRRYFIKLCYKEMLLWQGQKQRVFLELVAYFHDKKQPFEEEVRTLIRKDEETVKA